MSNFLAIDLQREFVSSDGKAYVYRPSVDVIQNTLFPFLRETGVQVAEVVSDYRFPILGVEEEYCVPGTAGYESIVPADLRNGRPWIKANTGLAWVRKNGGISDSVTGLPFPDWAALEAWTRIHLGPLGSTVIMFGLTLDCCVMRAAQDLRDLGYRIEIVIDATDTYRGTAENKEAVLRSDVFRNFASFINLRNTIGRATVR